MKKPFFCFAAMLSVLVAVMFLFSCAGDPMSGVSERRSGYYYAEGDGFKITAVSGVREQPFETDGTCGALKSYTLITVVPDVFDVDALYTYSAVTYGGEFGGALTVHPFAASFSAEFDSETTAAAFSVTIKTKEKEHVFELKSQKPESAVTFDRAIEQARRVISPPESCETRVRIVKNPLGDGLCWHVAFYSNSSSCAVLLDCVTLNTLAKKI